MRKKILLLDTNHDYIKETLLELNFEVHEDYTSSKSEVENKIVNYHGFVIRSRFSIDQTFLDYAANLEFIARVGAGLENIDCDYAQSKGIRLISAPEGNRDAVGEHAVGMLLSLMNYLNRADEEVRSGKWIREGNRGHEIMGKTVGLIGYGNMGKAFARRLQGFDCEVICYDIKENVGDQHAKQVDLETLFEKTDILSLHTPETELTTKMIHHDFIQSFKKNFYLINTARGKSVVTEDLVKALQSGKVIAAGLDVLEYEKSSFENLFEGVMPEALQYLIEAENVLLTPHIAGWTQESKFKLAKTIVDKIKQLYNYS
ncbi:phosphoglycerate dehydrogenase [Flavobacteriaceae bacterium UJ101]|nr:phosphoglycerate dehydrogenase [Flavobacteriaceae bacterium UJ101]